MPIPKELQAKLSRLKDILSEMKALLEWQKLRVYETTHNPSIRLFFHNDTTQQLSNRYAQFLFIRSEIDRILKTTPYVVKHSAILKDLHALYAQFYYLGTDVRVYG